MAWHLIRITSFALRSNNDRTRWKLLDLLVEQIGAEHHWIKVEQLFEYQTYFVRYSICCKCVKDKSFLLDKFSYCLVPWLDLECNCFYSYSHNNQVKYF